MDSRSACPDAEEILRWTAGQLVTTERHEEIEAHLAVCLSCGVDLDIALGVTEWVAEREAASFTELDDTAADCARKLRPVGAKLRRWRQDAERIFRLPSSEWPAKLAAHVDRDEAGFLRQVADQAVWYADEDPDGVRAIVAVIRPMLDGLPDTLSAGSIGDEARALVALAEGVTLRTMGDHVAALACYTRGEAFIDERALSHEYARLNVARATSLRFLHRLDEASAYLQLARQVFARFTDDAGEAKVLLELANVAYQMDRPRRALHAAIAAYRIFVDLHDDAQRAITLVAILGILVAIPRPRAARRVLRALEEDDYIKKNLFQRARVAWKHGKLEAGEKHMEEAAQLLEDAARMMGEAGAVRGAACAFLDLAHVAGLMGDIARQATAARNTIALLSGLSAQEAQLGLAAVQLQEALQSGVGLAELVVTLRGHLRTI